MVCWVSTTLTDTLRSKLLFEISFLFNSSACFYRAGMMARYTICHAPGREIYGFLLKSGQLYQKGTRTGQRTLPQMIEVRRLSRKRFFPRDSFSGIPARSRMDEFTHRAREWIMERAGTARRNHLLPDSFHLFIFMGPSLSLRHGVGRERQQPVGC